MIINGKKIKAKEIMEMTGRSERTVRKYFLNLVKSMKMKPQNVEEKPMS